jgi:BirA family biotin operon repressor/biotin-[acetyl-CoA-carboxylase] ligase
MLATPYFQERYDSVPSTQDVARERYDSLPLLVIASSQTQGRGRSGAHWDNADRAVAVSLVFASKAGDKRPISLMAGVAATRAVDGCFLKWPNDVLNDRGKVGGILVERSAGLTVVGLGLNLFWADPTPGSASVFESDPGESAHVAIAALWGAELMEILTRDGWPRDAYLAACTTLGRSVTWEPDGAGLAIDVADDGGLVVESRAGVETLYSGAIKHIRH